MAWQAYVDNIKQYASVTHGGVFGVDGSTWATTPGLQPNADELKALMVATTAERADMKPSYFISGHKLMSLRAFDNALDLKGTADISGTSNSIAVCVAKTDKALVVAMRMKPESEEGANQKVRTAATAVRDYLKNSGY